jgi:ferredoxin
MKACPTNALQPARLESGFEGMFTPVLVPRIGGCEEQCNLCGLVCPTGAIRKLPIEEKQYAVIGNAAIERNLCIAWEQLKVCLICDEVCPYDAVEFKMVTDEKGTLQRPFVIEDKCVGCGQCEMGCPVNGPAAIHVTPVGEVRKNSGSYITEEVKRLREVHDDDVDFYEEGDIQSRTPEEEQTLQPWEQPGKTGDDLPPGFVE